MRIMLFAGAEKGAFICSELTGLGAVIEVYGECKGAIEEYEGTNNVNVHTVDLNAENIISEYENIKPDAVIDAAKEEDISIHEILKEIVPAKSYIRLREERKKLNAAYCDSMKHTVAVVNRIRKCGVYFTTGYRELETISGVTDCRKRVYIDMPEENRLLRLAAANGISLSHINDIVYSNEEELVKIINEKSIKYIVAKENDDERKTEILCSAAEKTNIILILLKAEEDCFTYEQVLERIQALCKNKKVYIIDAGAGNPKNMTIEALETIEKCDTVIGSRKSIAGIEIKNKDIYFTKNDGDIKNFINTHFYKNLAVIACEQNSNINSIAEFTEKLNDCSVTIVPGVPVAAYMGAKLGIEWRNCPVIKGEEENVIKAVSENNGVFVFADVSANNILKILQERGYDDVTACIGERLSYIDEKITTGYVYELAGGDYDSNTVIYFANEKHRSNGSVVSDEKIAVYDTHILNSGVRSILINYINLRGNKIVYDIGAGCGAMAIEMAMISNKSRIYAIDKSKKATELIKKNCGRYNISNIEAIWGDGAKKVWTLPKPDYVLIEGCDGRETALVKDITSTLGVTEEKKEIFLAVVTEELYEVCELLYWLNRWEFTEIEIKEAGNNKDRYNNENRESKNVSFIITGKGEI